MLSKELVLRPNCLLTRYSIVFLLPHKPLLSFNNPWKKALNYLSQHGYDCRLEKRWLHLKNCHILIDPTSYEKIKDQLQTLPERTTLNIVNSYPPESLAELDRLLDLCIELAELDFQND